MREESSSCTYIHIYLMLGHVLVSVVSLYKVQQGLNLFVLFHNLHELVNKTSPKPWPRAFYKATKDRNLNRRLSKLKPLNGISHELHHVEKHMVWKDHLFS